MASKTKQLTTLAMLTAIAYVIGMFVRIRFMPGAPFLTYDPKDVVIVIGGFMFGPLSALAISWVLAFSEMVTHSMSGPWGMLMNGTTSAAFACTAAVIYKRYRSIQGAVAGIILGVILTTLVAMLMNYLVVPLFTGWERERVAGMLIPVFMPFNLIKWTLNGAIAMIMYKPITTALAAAKLYRPVSTKGKPNLGVLLVSALVLVSVILVILVIRSNGS